MLKYLQVRNLIQSNMWCEKFYVDYLVHALFVHIRNFLFIEYYLMLSKFKIPTSFVFKQKC